MAQSAITPTRKQVDAAIRAMARDYVEGWANGDPAGMERSLHPELRKRIVRTGGSPLSTWPPGDRLDEMSALRLVQLTRRDPTREAKRNMAVTILDRFEHIASVKIGRNDPWDWDYAP